MIDIRNLVFGYEKAKPILNKFNLYIDEGECLGIQGASGSGKTTLLRLIAGLEQVGGGKASGSIYIGGEDMQQVPAYKRNVGFIFQKLVLFPHLNVEQNILFAVAKEPREKQVEKLNELSQLLEIKAYLRRYPHELSHGQAQRVAIARALAQDPDVLLFDEPFSALDTELKTKMRVEIRELLTTLNKTCIIVSHDCDDLDSICDRIISLS